MEAIRKYLDKKINEERRTLHKKGSSEYWMSIGAIRSMKKTLKRIGYSYSNHTWQSYKTAGRG